MSALLAWLKVQSQAIATAVSAVANFLVLRGIIDWSTSDVTAFNLAYASVIIVLRQLFSVTPPADD